MTETVNIVCPHCDATNRLPAARDAKAAKCGRCGQALFTGQPVDLTAARFRKHLTNSQIPIVADFWAAWCGPCKAIAPIFARSAAELEPRARFVKIDVDAEPALAAEFGVRGIPALFLFKGGKVAANQSGLPDAGFFRRWLDQHAPVQAKV